MKIAVLSDAHGNVLYFNRCMKEIGKIKLDKIIFLGDCFGYLHEGNVILSKLRERNAQILMGNHEAMLLGKIPYDIKKEEVYGIEIDRNDISDDNLTYIRELPPELYEETDNKRILYVHGCPDNPLIGYLYENDETFNWQQNEYDFVFMGHTHRPYIKKVGTTTYVNAGSCGLPRDIGTAPSYAVFDTKTGEVFIQRVLICKRELEKVEQKKIHPDVYKCLMREGK